MSGRHLLVDKIRGVVGVGDKRRHGKVCSREWRRAGCGPINEFSHEYLMRFT